MRDAWRSHRRVHRGSRGNASFVQYEWMGSGTTRHPVGRTDRGEGRVRLVYAFIFHDRYFKRAPGAHGTKGGDGGEKPRKTLRPTLKSESSGRETLRRLLVFAAFIPWTPITPIENDVPRSDPVPIHLICGVFTVNRGRMVCSSCLDYAAIVRRSFMARFKAMILIVRAHCSLLMDLEKVSVRVLRFLNWIV